jgi:NAD(P)-dependent dehydrogenase (short-subunit alcohol dehydrogenase family)
VSGRTVLVTGAGGGIGRACVEAFADRGWRAVAGVRDPAAAEAAYAGREGVRIVALDVTDAAQVESGVAAAERHAGGALTCLVNNAGHGVLGAVEEVDLDAVRAMFETNLIGAAAVTQRALPAMRAAGTGTIVNVSSVGARIVNPMVGMYHASKYALSAMGEALALELRPFGIRVVTVEPGMVETGFSRAVRPTGRAPAGEGPYAPLLDGVRRGFGEWKARYAVGPDDVAAAVLGAATDPATPFRVEVGDDTRLLAQERAGRDDHAFHDWQVGFLSLDWPRRADGGAP